MSDSDLADVSSSSECVDAFFRQLDIQMLVHDMKGPLGIIETNARMLLDARSPLGPLTAPQRRAMERSLRSSARLQRMIHGLLEVGSCRQGRGRLREFQLVPATAAKLTELLESEIAGACLQPAHETGSTLEHQREHLKANGIHLEVPPDLEATILRQDQRRFESMLGNLVGNALKNRVAEVIVDMALVDETIIIRVCDDGPGIAPDVQADLFKPYKQRGENGARRGPKGHGFGLAAARIMACSLGGDITFDERYHDGAAFVLRLPTTVPDAQQLDE